MTELTQRRQHDSVSSGAGLVGMGGEISKSVLDMFSLGCL